MENTNISSKQGNRIKQKASWFCGTTKNPVDMESIERNIKEFPFFAFIYHTPDVECVDKHIHFLLNIKGSRSIKSIAEALNCDYGDVQKCDRPRSYARYLIHLDDKEKGQYKVSDIVSNNPDRLAYYFSDIAPDSLNLYSDFKLLRCGRISADEFVEKYKGEFANLNFYQKIRIFSEIDSNSNIKI